MKLPYSLLKEWVDFDHSPEDLADLITMAGFEVEDIEQVEGDHILDIAIMSNRGDGASAAGIAREIIAKSATAKPTELYKTHQKRLTDLADQQRQDEGAATATIESSACTRYAALTITGIENGDSPEWLKTRLKQMGQRPINLLVDLTNFVMRETGQPLHAFDTTKLASPKITIRQAKHTERITTLDEVERELNENDLVICDDKGPIAVAGVMGGLDTEVDSNTTTTVIESAHFNNLSVRRTRKRLGLNTDASYRFERHVDPSGTVVALVRFQELLDQILERSVDAKLYDTVSLPAQKPTVGVRLERANHILGLSITEDQANQYLAALGYEPKAEGDRITATVPTWRIDIQREEDLIEELGRIHGYEHIPEELPPLGWPEDAVSIEPLVDDLLDALVAAGLTQIWGHSLKRESPLDNPHAKRIHLKGIADPETGSLRTSSWPSLADAALRNGAKNIALFENARVFSDKDEKRVIGVLAHGRTHPTLWNAPSSTHDFYSVKGAIQSAFERVGVHIHAISPNVADNRLHPTQQAHLLAGQVPIGVMGRIHPDTAEASGLDHETILAEIELVPALETSKQEKKIGDLSKNPPVKRDLSMVAPNSIPYADVEATIASSGGPDLEDFWLFDLYQGENLAEGTRSLGVSLQFRRLDHNLTDEDANQLRDKIVQALSQLGIELR